MSEKKSEFNIAGLVNNDGCFDLQFRKDTHHERTNAPTYYRWKIQFVITSPKTHIGVLQKVKKMVGCGTVSVTKEQARFSVQKIEDIAEVIVPFFNAHKLTDNKKKDFELWKRAVSIISKNKGKNIRAWKKHDLLQLLQIHASSVRYKNKPKKPKWMAAAKAMAKSY